MFDRCRVWRDKLTRLLDGTLPLGEWAALEDHLSRCARCSKAQEGDRALREVCQRHRGMSSPESTRLFDERVITTLQAQPASALTLPGWLDTRWRQAQARWSGPSFEFLTQLTGGALIAASITAVCFLTALHPTGSAVPITKPDSNPAVTAQNEPPVPLETLLQSASPRAAMLWRTPTSEHHASREAQPPAHTEPAPSPPQKSSPAEPRPHGEKIPSAAMG